MGYVIIETFFLLLKSSKDLILSLNSKGQEPHQTLDTLLKHKRTKLVYFTNLPNYL